MTNASAKLPAILRIGRILATAILAVACSSGRPAADQPSIVGPPDAGPHAARPDATAPDAAMVAEASPPPDAGPIDEAPPPEITADNRCLRDADCVLLNPRHCDRACEFCRQLRIAVNNATYRASMKGCDRSGGGSSGRRSMGGKQSKDEARSPVICPDRRCDDDQLPGPSGVRCDRGACIALYDSTPPASRRAIVKAGMAPVIPGVKECMRKHRVTGQITVRVRIAPTGRVVSATADSFTGTGDSGSVTRAQRCAENVVGRARFERFDGDEISAKYPFVQSDETP